MSQNIEDLKNKIIYRASYRGSKEMDILMLSFVRYILKELADDDLKTLNDFVNMDDETLISLKNKKFLTNIKNVKIIKIIEKFQKFKL